jgi:hypothetical protein
LEIRPTSWFTFAADDGLSGYATRRDLVIVYRDQGRVAEAEEQWRQALADLPSFTPAPLGLDEFSPFKSDPNSTWRPSRRNFRYPSRNLQLGSDRTR